MTSHNAAEVSEGGTVGLGEDTTHQDIESEKEWRLVRGKTCKMYAYSHIDSDTDEEAADDKNKQK